MWGDSCFALRFRQSLPRLLICSTIWWTGCISAICRKPGADALTGVGVALPVILAISAFAYLFSAGGAARASIMMGKKKKDEAERIMGNCAAALILAALALTVFFQVFGRDILMIFGASTRTIDYAWNYMQIYSLGTLFVQIALGLNNSATLRDMP